MQNLLALALMIVTILAYVVVGAWLAVTGRPVRAGLAMIAIATFPLLWQVALSDTDAPGFGILLLIMLPVPLLLVAVGILGRLFRWGSNRMGVTTNGSMR